MKQRLVLIILLPFTLLPMARADRLDLALNDEAVRFAYAMDYGTFEVPFGAFYASRDNGDRDWFAHAGFEVTGQSELGRGFLSGNIGLQLYQIEVGDFDITSLTVGGHAKWYPANKRIGVGVMAYYGPGAITWGDGDRFWEAAARVEFRLFDRGIVYAGYRQSKARVEDTGRSVTVDDDPMVGIELSF